MTGRPFPEAYFVVKCHTCGKYYGIARDRKQGGLEAFLARGPRCINTGGNVDTSGRRAYYGVVPPGQVCGALLGRGMWGRNQGDIRIATREELLALTVVRRAEVVDRQRYIDLERELAQARKDLDTVQRELTTQAVMQPALQPVEAPAPVEPLTHRQTIEYAKLLLVGEFPDVELVKRNDEAAYLSVPTGHAGAIELELQDGKYYVTGRTWDRTGGLADEHEFGESSNFYGGINLIKGAVRRTLAEQARLEAQLAESDEKGE